MARDDREVRAVAAGFAAVLLYMVVVLASGRVVPADFAHLFALYLTGSIALWMLLCFVALLVLLAKNARPPAGELRVSPFAVIARYVAERWRRDRLLSLCWPPLLFAALMASFNAFKQMVLPGAGFAFDPLFAEIDRALFLGHDPWRVTHALFSPMGTLWIDRAYHGWFAPMSLGVLLCAFGARRSYRLRTQYLLSYIAVWIVIGSVFAYLLPSAGPCFDPVFASGAPGFQPLLDRLAHDQAVIRQTIPGAHLAALANQHGLLAAYGSQSLFVGGGISAMPSVHNGLSALFALAAFRLWRPLGWAVAAYALLIWVGSIHLGWHYAIDGIVSIAMTLGIWRVAGRLADRLERPIFARPPALAPAG
jgi:hypothetical protein